MRPPTRIPLNIIRWYTARPVKPTKAKGEGYTVLDRQHRFADWYGAARVKGKINKEPLIFIFGTEYFVDFKRVNVIGGKGGDGLIHFLAKAKNEFAGPDGGNGGHGGHVIFSATHSLKSLGHVKTVLKAPSGCNGRKNDMHSKNASHLYTRVPLGTIIRDGEGRQLSSLEKEEEYYIAARGGSGGKGNKHFASSADTTPRYAEEGAPGEDRILYLELKTMAHAGLIGFPNAGKSTLLRAISRARPKVAPYPFTTRNPHVGIVKYDDFEQIADIPGLIPDAHKNRGLGISFLRHIERCLCLLYVIDLSEHEPWLQLEQLQYELEQYKPGLSQRPHAIVANKMDLEISRIRFSELQKRTDLPLFPVSAEKRLGLKPLLIHLREMYDNYNAESDKG